MNYNINSFDYTCVKDYNNKNKFLAEINSFNSTVPFIKIYFINK